MEGASEPVAYTFVSPPPREPPRWHPLHLKVGVQSRVPIGPKVVSFLGLPYRILTVNPKKELPWGLWEELYSLLDNFLRGRSTVLQVYRKT